MIIQFGGQEFPSNFAIGLDGSGLVALDPEPGGQVLEEHGVGGPVDCLAAGPRAQGELLLQLLRRQHGHTALADLGLMSDQSKREGAGVEDTWEEDSGQHGHGGLHGTTTPGFYWPGTAPPF